MKAMIFAAGLGTRLRPFTNDRPKAMVEVKGKPLIERAIDSLSHHGFSEIIINVHHFAEQIINFVQQHKFDSLKIHISDERDRLLDTGGGLKKAKKWLDDGPFLVYNTDIITDLNLSAFYQYHLKKQGLATLAVRKRESSRYLLFNDRSILSGWRNIKTGDQKLCRPTEHYNDMAFSGIHVIDPEIFDFMPEKAVFSIIDVYLKAGETKDIFAYDHSDTFWMDVGRVKDLERAPREIQKYLGE